MDRIEIDVQTGEIKIVSLTADEIAALPQPLAEIPSITPLQALLWLSAHGKGDADVRAVINTISETTTKLQALAYWDRATTFLHDNTFIVMLWSALSISISVDEAFIEASKL